MRHCKYIRFTSPINMRHCNYVMFTILYTDNIPVIVPEFGISRTFSIIKMEKFSVCKPQLGIPLETLLVIKMFSWIGVGI